MNTRQRTLLCLTILPVVVTGCSMNPLTGDDEFMLFKEDWDFSIGQSMAPELEKAMEGRIEDEALQRYIDRIGQNIARVCHHPEWDYYYTAVESNQVNALALPGGYIFITRGMLEKLESEAQLAAILGHETAHVVGRDSANALSKQTGMQLASLAAALADPAAGAGALYTTQFLMLTYSRGDETQADISGLDYMVQAGYDPQGIIQVMNMLENLMIRRPVEFFSTHPLPENRLYRLNELINTRYPNTRGSTRVGKAEYQKQVLDYLSKHPYQEKEPKKRGQHTQADRFDWTSHSRGGCGCVFGQGLEEALANTQVKDTAGRLR